jgi:DNA-binding winged helix-turn-helix (wHTH) protein
MVSCGRGDAFAARLRERGEGPIISGGAREKPLSLYTFDDVQVDTAGFRVERAGQTVPLEPKAFDLLVLLLERHGNLVTKQEILDTVWRQTAVSDNALTRIVAHLRKALGDDARDARYIETVPTRGYRFIATVSGRTAVDGETPAAETPAGDTATPGAALSPADPLESQEQVRFARRRGDRRRPWLILAVSAVVLLAAGWAWRLSRPEPRTDAAGDVGTAPFDLASFEQMTFAVGLDAFPTFSPDGAMLAFSSNRGGGFELFAKSFAPGGAERQITEDGQQNVQPDWSPDGRLLPTTRSRAAVCGRSPPAAVRRA